MYSPVIFISTRLYPHCLIPDVPVTLKGSLSPLAAIPSQPGAPNLLSLDFTLNTHMDGTTRQDVKHLKRSALFR